MTGFTKFYRFAWMCLIGLLIFLDRQNIYLVILTISLLFILSTIAILRAIESRKQWREYFKQEELDEEIF